jgi:hypothetical protein
MCRAICQLVLWFNLIEGLPPERESSIVNLLGAQPSAPAGCWKQPTGTCDGRGP